MAESRTAILTFPARAVVFKLLAFTATMVIAPIGSYFLSVNTIFQGMTSQNLPPEPAMGKFDVLTLWGFLVGNSTYAGALAAIIANIVLLSYVFVAFNEDSGEESKKEK